MSETIKAATTSWQITGSVTNIFHNSCVTPANIIRIVEAIKQIVYFEEKTQHFVAVKLIYCYVD